jgi:hypothetical protein
VAARGPVGIQAGVGIVEFEFPGAVEILPEFTLKLRLGKLGAGRRGPECGGKEDQKKAHCDMFRKVYCNYP